MGNCDIAATVLSSLALLVSAATLYLTFFRKHAALIGCLTAVTTPNPDEIENCVFDFALANSGTLELLVREVSVDFMSPAAGLVPEISPAALPAVLKPGQVQLLRLEIPNLFLSKVAQSGQAVSLQFHVFSSRGTLYRPSKVLAPQGEVHDLPPDTWVPFKLGAPE